MSSTSQVRGPEAEKIRSMFNEIAHGYDRTNTILSGGIHHLWRKALVKWSGARAGMRVLDCATGTGDLAIEFKRAVGSTGQVIGTDFSPEMLKPAPAKAAKLGLDIEFQQADVTQLSFGDSSFDISSISFGIRNVQEPAKGLLELARVVRPGGVVMVLEFGQPSLPGFREVYDLYSRHVLPRLGGLVTGKMQAYEYLQNSASNFPCGNEFVALMKSTGRFESIEYRQLTFGVVYMYKGVVRA